MNYIWKNYEKAQRFSVSTDISSYEECQWGGENAVLVNLHSRLSRILLPKSYVKEVGEEMLWEQYLSDPRYEDIANLLLHYQANLDMRIGFSPLDYLCYLEEESILEGRYGKLFQDRFTGLTQKDRDILLPFMAVYNQKRQKEVIFTEVLETIFEGIAFRNEEDTGIFHIHIPVQKTEYFALLFQCICDLFVPITVVLSVVWAGQCVGFIGMEETMVIGHLSIY